MLHKPAINEAEIHDLRRSRELQMVARTKAGEPVWPLKNFVAHPHAPPGGKQSKIGERVDLQISRVVPANHHGKGILKTQRLQHFQTKSLRVKLLHAIVDVRRRALGFLVQHGGQRRAGVFDIEVKIPGKQRFMDQQGAPEIRLANHRDAGPRFDVLRQKLCQHHLLGEEFRADRDSRLRGLHAAGNQPRHITQAQTANNHGDR